MHQNAHIHAHTEAVSRINESRTWRVFILTFLMMGIEIAAGYFTGSMALLADGWHMGTHAAAFGITIFAYRYARRNQNNNQFSFGTGKVNTLGGFASAVALAVVALFMIIESVERFISPLDIQFNEAIIVALMGLGINVLSAVLLMGTSLEKHTGKHAQQDHNLRAAYIHVLADALTSLLAISALLMGKYLGWTNMDPLIGIVGALVILRWSYTLVATTANILLDRAAGGDEEAEIRRILNDDPEFQMSDLRLWYTGPNKMGLAIKVRYEKGHLRITGRALQKKIPALAYINIECSQQPG